MESRLIIAYSLIALMVALAAYGVIWVSKKRKSERRRPSGRGSHL